MFKVLERIFKDKIATEQIALTGSDRLRGKIEGSCNSDCLNKCAKACPVKAFQVEGNDYKIDYKKCLFCGKCVEACPMGVLVAGDNNPSKCIACGICAKACPMDVLEVVEK